MCNGVKLKFEIDVSFQDKTKINNKLLPGIFIHYSLQESPGFLKCRQTKFNILKNIATIYSNTGKDSFSQSRQVESHYIGTSQFAGNAHSSHYSSFSESQARHPTRRYIKGGTENASDDRERMEKSWGTTESWLDPLHDSRPRTPRTAISEATARQRTNLSTAVQWDFCPMNREIKTTESK